MGVIDPSSNCGCVDGRPAGVWMVDCGCDRPVVRTAGVWMGDPRVCGWVAAGFFAGAILRSPVLQWLGVLSLPVFLLHWPIILYLNWARSKWSKQRWPARLDFGCEFAGTCAKYEDEPWWVPATRSPGGEEG
eukprot:903400-Prorocentrum_minimum.AAC.1